MARVRAEWPRLTTVGIFFLLIPVLAMAGFSVDEDPRETPWDPGDIWFPGGACDMDDADGSCPFVPSLLLPQPGIFDMDALAVDEPLVVCPGADWPEGILFSFDDGDGGPGVGAPDHFTEIFYYDHCLDWGPVQQSYYTSITEVALGLGNDPPPTAEDDDVDAYETRPAGSNFLQGLTILFSPDTPSHGGLGPGSEAHIWWVNSMSLAPAIWANAATHLGVPDPENCDIDGIARIEEEETTYVVLFTTDANAPCGLDPGDIYVSDTAGNYWPYADDVLDMKIAVDEDDPVDIDALAINDRGTFDIIDPYDPPPPPDTTYYKADWPNYAPSGMPDFSQDHAPWPPTWCGPSAVADSFWWFDSEMECDLDRTSGDLVETEINDTCNASDSLGEAPAIPGGFGAATDEDWYVFDVPYSPRVPRCTVTVSTCARRLPGDADTHLELYSACVSGLPSGLIAVNDNDCPLDTQSEITRPLEGGRYWVKVSHGGTGVGGPYTLSLGIDCHPLVERYDKFVTGLTTHDDHSDDNPLELIQDLSNCMNTDDQHGAGSWLGTKVTDMQACIDTWLIRKGLDTRYYERTVYAPYFDEVEEEIERSEDVILLLGFYWYDAVDDVWYRCGGHYVTSAGVNSDEATITLSDPALNNAEPPPYGNSAPGRVRGPTHIDHAPALNPPPDHDDAQNISHDRYGIGPPAVVPPIANWTIPNYATSGGPTSCNDVARWCSGSDWGQNPLDPPGPHLPNDCPATDIPVSVEVEAMVDVSPHQTPLCIYLDTSVSWPVNLRVWKRPCLGTSTAISYDVIRGKVCNLRFSMLAPQVDLGYVQCLYDDVFFDQYKELSPDITECFGATFFLVRQSTDVNYGHAHPGGESRHPSSGGCP